MGTKFMRRLRRGTITSKRGNQDYYKGYGARTEGVHTSKGAFVVLPERLMTIRAPDMAGCKVRAAATQHLSTVSGALAGHADRNPHTAAVVLEPNGWSQWLEPNGRATLKHAFEGVCAKTYA